MNEDQVSFKWVCHWFHCKISKEVFPCNFQAMYKDEILFQPRLLFLSLMEGRWWQNTARREYSGLGRRCTGWCVQFWSQIQDNFAERRALKLTILHCTKRWPRFNPTFEVLSSSSWVRFSQISPSGLKNVAAWMLIAGALVVVSVWGASSPLYSVHPDFCSKVLKAIKPYFRQTK